MKYLLIVEYKVAVRTNMNSHLECSFPLFNRLPRVKISITPATTHYHHYLFSIGGSLISLDYSHLHKAPEVLKA